MQVRTGPSRTPKPSAFVNFLLKGGFLMVDDFHGTADWESFLRGMRMVFPDRPIEDLDNKR